MAKVVHFLTSISAAATLFYALKKIGSSDSVIATGDDLSYGPIDEDLSRRIAWLDENLGEHYGALVAEADKRWEKILEPEYFPIIWVCRSHAGDHAGYLELVSRIDDRPFEVVDATGLTLQIRNDSWRIPSLGVVNEQQMIDANLFNRRKHMTKQEISKCRDKWKKLKAENALLRITEEDELLSKPLSYFDATLLGQVGLHWERGVRVVGDAMGHFFVENRSISDSFIWSRYRALGAEGKMEFDGDEADMRACNVRRITS